MGIQFHRNAITSFHTQTIAANQNYPPVVLFAAVHSQQFWIGIDRFQVESLQANGMPRIAP